MDILAVFVRFLTYFFVINCAVNKFSRFARLGVVSIDYRF
jgi:hypothetical protein